MESVKYIIFDWPERGKIPIIFPSSIYHWEIAKSIQSVFPDVSPVRAGFVGESFECSGSSDTLQLRSNPIIDNILIRSLFTN